MRDIHLRTYAVSFRIFRSVGHVDLATGEHLRGRFSASKAASPITLINPPISSSPLTEKGDLSFGYEYASTLSEHALIEIGWFLADDVANSSLRIKV